MRVFFLIAGIYCIEIRLCIFFFLPLEFVLWHLGWHPVCIVLGESGRPCNMFHKQRNRIAFHDWDSRCDSITDLISVFLLWDQLYNILKWMRISELSEEGQVWPWLHKHAVLCVLGNRVLATDTVTCMWQSSSRCILLGNWWPGAMIYVPGPTASISPHSLSTGTQTFCIYLTWTSELWILHSCVVRKSCPEPLKREYTEDQRSQTQWFAACFLDFMKREGPAAAKEEKARLLTGRDTWSRACVCYWCLASSGEQKPGNFSNSD